MLQALVILSVSIFGLNALKYRSTYNQQSLKGVGGRDAKIEEFPYQASLEYDGRHTCGATIIDFNILVTAAQCVYKKDTKMMTIRVGSSTKSLGGEVIDVLHIETHPKFSLRLWSYNVAVVWLERPMQYGPTILPIGLAKPLEKQKSGTKAISTGWSTLYGDANKESDLLQFVDLEVISFDDCNKTYGFILTKSMFCAASTPKEVGTCTGDCGGPFVAGSTLVGILSYGVACSDVAPLIITDVASLSTWIFKTIQENPSFLVIP